MKQVALALGAGAGLGWAHIGVLRALQQRDVHVAAIAGTSIGAIVGAAYACGVLDQMEDIARSLKLRSYFRYLDPKWKKGALMGGKAIERELRKYLGDRRIDDLPIGFAAVASDLVSGEVHVMGRGALVPAVRASMSIPGLFEPVALDGRWLIDGGAILPVPVAPARKLAPDLPVIGVSLQNDYPARAREAKITPQGKLPGSLSVVKASIGVTMTSLARWSLELEPPDLLLNLPVGHIDLQDFTRADELINIGHRCMLEQLDNSPIFIS